MIRNILLLTTACISFFVHGQATQHDCAAHTITEKYLAQQGLSTDLLAALPHVNGSFRGGSYTVPVVVHVVYNTTAENVSDATIMAMVNQMNQDYSGSNSDIGTVRPAFTNVVANVGFNFCLAQIDPSGNATTGITRTQTSQTWFDPDTETNLMKEAQFGKTPWNTNQYLNIWVCDITSGASGGFITVGYAYLPVGGVVGSGIDGLVIDYNYGLNPGDRTATHEIGHYFGLQHTFDDNGTCNNTDGFTDTPNTNSPTYSCSNTNLMKCGVLTQYENFMDYSNCSAMFTDQQANYMAGILTGVRSGLLSNPACGGTSGYCIPTAATGTSDGDFINSVQLGTINNLNTGGITAPAYTNFSATHSTNLLQGTQYTLTVQGGTYQPDHYTAWIDYDQDETFEASEKMTEVTSSAANETMTFTFTVPASATLGGTRMRVRGAYHNTGEPTPNTDPCFAYAFGETEDYGITIQSATTTGYCIPTSATGTADGDFINSVVMGSINNQNTGGITEPPYSDFSSTQNTVLISGVEYTLIVQGGTYQPDHYAAWIDYDQDEVFEASEKLDELVSSAVDEVLMFTFTVPPTAMSGSTRMRIRGVYHDTGEPTPDTDPCFAYAYGETEDYGITIQANTSGNYCVPSSAFGTVDGDFINSVQLGSINNVNSGPSSSPYFNDLSAIHSTSLVLGTQYTLTVQGGTYQPDHFTAWIDFDQDQTFEISEKMAEVVTSSVDQIMTFVFTVPANATIGNTRMRVRGVYHTNGEPTPDTDPCYAYNYGETEDYGIVIDVNTGINSTDHSSIQVYPNPAGSTVQVVLPANQYALIELVDLQGRTVANYTSTSTLKTLDLEGIADGTYVLRIRQGDTLLTKHLVVNNRVH